MPPPLASSFEEKEDVPFALLFEIDPVLSSETREKPDPPMTMPPPPAVATLPLRVPLLFKVTLLFEPFTKMPPPRVARFASTRALLMAMVTLSAAA